MHKWGVLVIKSKPEQYYTISVCIQSLSKRVYQLDISESCHVLTVCDPVTGSQVTGSVQCPGWA